MKKATGVKEEEEVAKPVKKKKKAS
jgi:hypothetical protein